MKRDCFESSSAASTTCTITSAYGSTENEGGDNAHQRFDSRILVIFSYIESTRIDDLQDESFK